MTDLACVSGCIEGCFSVGHVPRRELLCDGWGALAFSFSDSAAFPKWVQHLQSCLCPIIYLPVNVVSFKNFSRSGSVAMYIMISLSDFNLYFPYEFEHLFICLLDISISFFLFSVMGLFKSFVGAGSWDGLYFSCWFVGVPCRFLISSLCQLCLILWLVF